MFIEAYTNYYTVDGKTPDVAGAGDCVYVAVSAIVRLASMCGWCELLTLDQRSYYVPRKPADVAKALGITPLETYWYPDGQSGPELSRAKAALI